MSNYDVIKEGVRRFGGATSSTVVVKDVFAIIEAIADDLFKEINGLIPKDTGNLIESTGIAVYHGDRLIRIIVNPKTVAHEPRVNIGLRGFEKGAYWGCDLLEKAITHAAGKFKDGGYYLVLFSAMPYAGIVDKHQSYFSNSIVNRLNTIAKVSTSHTNITFQRVNR